uniref:Uncharacterized protein n=1 Tax=Anguilla anguilla TaxID=7936 RepID=A0A0E9VMT3_ANGAN
MLKQHQTSEEYWPLSDRHFKNYLIVLPCLGFSALLRTNSQSSLRDYRRRFSNLPNIRRVQTRWVS